MIYRLHIIYRCKETMKRCIAFGNSLWNKMMQITLNKLEIGSYLAELQNKEHDETENNLPLYWRRRNSLCSNFIFASKMFLGTRGGSPKWFVPLNKQIIKRRKSRLIRGQCGTIFVEMFLFTKQKIWRLKYSRDVPHFSRINQTTWTNEVNAIETTKPRPSRSTAGVVDGTLKSI